MIESSQFRNAEHQIELEDEKHLRISTRVEDAVIAQGCTSLPPQIKSSWALVYRVLIEFQEYREASSMDKRCVQVATIVLRFFLHAYDLSKTFQWQPNLVDRPAADGGAVKRLDGSIWFQHHVLLHSINRDYPAQKVKPREVTKILKAAGVKTKQSCRVGDDVLQYQVMTAAAIKKLRIASDQIVGTDSQEPVG